MARLTRRKVLAGSAVVLVGETVARAGVIAGHLPFTPAMSDTPASPDVPWAFFTPAEAAMVEAMADRIIPPDPETPGGREAGCAVFIDRQLAGAYGKREGQYVKRPFEKGFPQQGPQSPASPADLYRSALAAVEAYCRSRPGGRAFVDLPIEEQDGVLQQLEASGIALENVDSKAFFEALLKDVQEGFFADPAYGGNRDMCAWKMIGFPGAHYDYREWVGRHNERYPHPPVSIVGRPDWNVAKS